MIVSDHWELNHIRLKCFTSHSGTTTGTLLTAKSFFFAELRPLKSSIPLVLRHLSLLWISHSWPRKFHISSSSTTRPVFFFRNPLFFNLFQISSIKNPLIYLGNFQSHSEELPSSTVRDWQVKIDGFSSSDFFVITSWLVMSHTWIAMNNLPIKHLY